MGLRILMPIAAKTRRIKFLRLRHDFFLSAIRRAKLAESFIHSELPCGGGGGEDDLFTKKLNIKAIFTLKGRKKSSPFFKRINKNPRFCKNKPKPAQRPQLNQ